MTALDSLRVYQVTALYGVTVAEVNSAIDLSDEQIAAYNPHPHRQAPRPPPRRLTPTPTGTHP